MDSIDVIIPSTTGPLQSYANVQFDALVKAQERIKQLEGEVAHLKNLLATTPLSNDEPIRIIVSDEQTICEMEILRLKETSFKRGLTLEETKRLDLLVKNLHLSKEGQKDINIPFKNLTGVSTQTLIDIAAQPEDDEE